MFDINILDIIVIAASVFGGYSLPQPWWAKLAQDWVISKIRAIFIKNK